jgi:ligand-binding sensor domain-containing protein/DNA-binding CsgD family transcriptional regulator
MALWLPAVFTALTAAYGAKPNVLNFYRYQYQAANKNWAVGQDEQGILYFGNDNGLLEFDGLRWQLYHPPGDKVVRAVAAGPGGRIYTGGYEEFGYWQSGLSGSLEYTSLSRMLPDGVMHNDDIWKILLTEHGVYFQSFKQVYLYDPATRQVSACRNADGNILFLHSVHSRLWVQVMGGALYELDGKEFIRIPGSDFLSRTEVRIILPYGEQWLIGTSSGGLFLYDGHAFRPWNTEFAKEVLSCELNNGIMGSNGNYFFGTILNGMYEVDAEGHIVNHLSADNLLPNSTVLNLYEEQSGNVWLALDRGISYVQYMDGMDCYIAPKGNVGAVYTAAVHRGNLYLGTNQGLFYMPVEELDASGYPEKLRFVEGTQGQIWDLREIDGELLCGHNSGLKIIAAGRVAYSVPHIAGVYSIQKLNVAGRDVLFLGTYTTAHILHREEQRWKLVANRDLMQFVEPVYRIQQDHLGNIWLEHIKEGVYRCIFSEDLSAVKHIQRYGLPDTPLQMFRIGDRVVFAGNDSLFVYSDIENRLEFHGGLSRCFEGVSRIRNIIPVSKTRFWAVTDHCLYHIFYDGHESHINYRLDLSYDNLSLINNYENIAVLNDSLSLVCLDNGFLLHTMRRETSPAPPCFKPCLRTVAAISKKKQTVYLDRNAPGAELAYEYNTLRFGFFVKNMLPQKRYFQTRLKGVDDNWSDPRQIPEVTYERLPEGRYTFMLRTTDAFGQFSEETSFAFTVLPPWYSSGRAYAGYVCLALLLAYAGWKLWFRQMRNRQIMKVRMREEQRLRRINHELHAEIEHKSSELYAQTMFMIRKNELMEKVKKEIDNFYNGLSGHKTLRPLYERIETLLNRNMDAEDDWKMFLIRFEQHHKDFFKHLISTYPGLTSNDLKLCACLKLNLASKDIASLMGISLRGVENSRYRLRKKLNLASSQNLNDFFLRF